MKISPQYSADAEQGTLSSMLQDSKVIATCVIKISPEYFFIPAHRTCYTELVDLWNNGKPVDLISFTQHLRDKKLLDEVGGAPFVTSLFSFVPTSANVDYYLDILREKFVLREIIAAGTTAVYQANQNQSEPDKILEEFQTRLLKVSEPLNVSDKTTKEYSAEALQEISEAYENKGKIPGLETGLIDLDKKLGGMRPKQFIVIAGETGQGKTALALKIAEHLGIRHDIPVGIISLEMGGSELCNRWIGSLARIDIHRFTTEGGEQHEIRKIVGAASKINESKVVIKDESDVTTLQMRAIARQLKHQHKIQLLIVDYIQLMSVSNIDSREQQVASVAQAMKNCAKELDIVVVGLSQVNDEGRVRDSRAIGFHADKVLFIAHDENGSWINVKKNRGGPTGPVGVAFLRQFATFENLSRIPEVGKLSDSVPL